MDSVSIIIPAYNEEKRIPYTLQRIKKYLKSCRFSHEIIVVNDGSTDKTREVSEKENVCVINNGKNVGKGYSIKKGMLSAKNDIVLFTDADLSTPIETFGKFYEEHLKGADIVIASRALKESVVAVKQPFYREKMGKIFNFFVRMITGLPIHDTQCGFKSFKKTVIEAVFDKQSVYDFGFDVEILYIAKLNGFKISEMPVEWHNSAATKVRALRDSALMFLDLFKIRSNHSRGKYTR